MSTGATKLYTQQVLELATSLANWPLDPGMPFQGRARSASCGSTLAMSLATAPDGAIAAVGLSAQACAVGQASAAIFAKAVCGLTRADIASSLQAIECWLKEGGALPDWPGLDAIAAAKAYPGRHGAVLLPWLSALDALP